MLSLKGRKVLIIYGLERTGETEPSCYLSDITMYQRRTSVLSMFLTYYYFGRSQKDEGKPTKPRLILIQALVTFSPLNGRCLEPRLIHIGPQDNRLNLGLPRLEGIVSLLRKAEGEQKHVSPFYLEMGR